MKQYKRSTRIGELILRDISRLFGDEYGDVVPAMITFTHVRVSDDLRYATVYYSCLGEDETRQRVAGFLGKEKKRIRYLIGKNMNIRYVPEFSFKFDQSVEDAIRIERLLNEIKNDSQE